MRLAKCFIKSIKTAVLSLLLCGSHVMVSGQALQLKGTVTDADNGEGLPGVNIQIKGTTSGASTDIDGNYSLNVEDPNATLIFSYIGYSKQSIAINNRSIIDVQLSPSTETLSEVVVTALGIEKDKKTLGFATQNVDGDELIQARETNVVNSLSGRIAGVQINQAGTGVGGTSKVVIRGYSAIASSNSPLYVIDGVPMQNPQGGGGQFGGLDYGDGISNINPEDIESINVLKGAGGTALYGSRGLNGVIMITTKKGKKRKGIGVSINSNFTAEQALVFPEFQNKFGRGSNGNYPLRDDGSFNNDLNNSWGPLMQGQDLPIWTGDTVAYSARPDNIRDFFRTGTTISNSVSLTGGGEKLQARASFSHLKNEGIMPNSNLERINALLAVNGELSDKLSIEAKFNYIKQDAFNRPNLTLSPDNPMNSLIQMPRNIRLSDLEDFRTPDGQPRLYTNGSINTWQNPYWAVNLNTNNDTRDRIIALVKLEYQLTEWLKVHLRSGTDFYNDFRQRRNATNTIYRIPFDRGFYSEYYGRNEERNTDVLFSAYYPINDNWSISGNLGGNLRRSTNRNISSQSEGLIIPNFFAIQNGANPRTSEGLSELRNNSVYGTFQVEYKDFLFIEGSGRNDWSSALPPGAWSYFYPGISTSFVFTEALDINWGPLNFGKLRLSYSEVGNDTGPGRLANVFAVNTLAHGGPALGQISPTRAPVDLQPERAQSYELGFDFGLYQNRISGNFTYYYAGTSGQIFEIPVSKASGFDEALVNAGLVVNQGIEVSLNFVPVEINQFKYETYFNFTRNRSEIVELLEDVDVVVLGGEYDQFGVSILAEAGGEFGDIYANQSYLRDDITGERIISPQGLPIPAPDGRKKIGNFQPDFLLGWGHNLSYKDFSFSALLDIRQGGDIFSFSNSVAAANGNAFYTRDDRLEWYAGAGGYIADGVNADGAPNAIEVDPQAYWQNVGGIGDVYAEEFLYDGSFVKLRELTFGYSLPSKWLENNPLNSLRLSLVGRNLFILHKNTPGFDPESTFNSGNAQGIEAFAFPSTRSFGLNVNLSL